MGDRVDNIPSGSLKQAVNLDKFESLFAIVYNPFFFIVLLGLGQTQNYSSFSDIFN